MLYQRLIRPLLFYLTRHDPERAHHWSMTALRLASAAAPARALTAALSRVDDRRLEREVFGIRFPNPVGLAAGYDKDGEAVPALAALGFGFIEVGTVTWRAQPGNPRPRIFRLPASQALINRMGFNNAGAEALAARLGRLARPAVPIGASIGKSRITPVDEAIPDYCRCLEVLYPFVDYFAINVSSPNTPGLRGLQDRRQLEDLLAALTSISRGLAGGRRPKPLLVKIAPDLTDAAVVEALEVSARAGIAGVIATNTTLSRHGVAAADAQDAAQAGGLSGAPLRTRAREVVALIHRESGGRLPVIGVGGILAPGDALALFDAGATLVQLYTGLVYAGPGLVRQILRASLAR
jgi:dihydroorotate dehydrogenase